MAERETIASILKKMKQIIEDNEIRSPGFWLDEAQKLAVLTQDLRNELDKAEIIYRNEVIELTEKDIPYNKAENMVKGRTLKEGEKYSAYGWYKYLTSRLDVVKEIIRIAKKRAEIEF